MVEGVLTNMLSTKSMTKDDVINKVKSLKLPKNSYIVFGSGPLAALGIREVNDIDLFVSEEAYKELKKKGWQKNYKGPKDEPLIYDVFEAHTNWNFSDYKPTLDELLTRALEFEDILFASIEDVREWKSVSRRPKDIIDLKLIDDYLTVPSQDL